MNNCKTIEINLDSVFNTKLSMADQTSLVITRYMENLAANFEKAKNEETKTCSGGGRLL